VAVTVTVNAALMNMFLYLKAAAVERVRAGAIWVARAARAARVARAVAAVPTTKSQPLNAVATAIVTRLVHPVHPVPQAKAQKVAREVAREVAKEAAREPLVMRTRMSPVGSRLAASMKRSAVGTAKMDASTNALSTVTTKQDDIVGS